MPVTLGQLNASDRPAFLAALGHLFEHSPWVADETWADRPFRDAPHLHAALVARVFHPFVQAEPGTSARYGGTGLGLSICRTIVEAHGGSIAVTSAPGQGTTFSIQLPRGTPTCSSTPRPASVGQLVSV